MQKAPTATRVSLEGFSFLGSVMNPIFVNPATAQVLAHPEKPETQRNLNSYLATRIRVALISEQPSNGSAVLPKFQSGRPTYLNRSFPVGGVGIGDSQASLAVILERASARPAFLAPLYKKFDLTTRKQQVAQFLLQGLTSKQIGVRMQISPNTVKAFLHLIMDNIRQFDSFRTVDQIGSAM